MPVLDLTETAVRERLGVAFSTLTGDTEADMEGCRSIADLARQRGFCAILSPSAGLSGSTNLNLYIDGPAGNYDLDQGPDRIPIS
jgi:hypothetical protein